MRSLLRTTPTLGAVTAALAVAALVAPAVPATAGTPSPVLLDVSNAVTGAAFAADQNTIEVPAVNGNGVASLAFGATDRQAHTYVVDGRTYTLSATQPTSGPISLTPGTYRVDRTTGTPLTGWIVVG